MSYTYLQEQGEESLAGCFADIPQYVLSRLNLIAEKSYSKDSETESCQSSQSGTMCELLTADHGEEKLTLFVEDFRAKTLVAREKEQESTENDLDYGPRWLGSFARYNPNTFLWKTHQCSLFGGLESFLEAWPRWGMMRDGECLGVEMSEYQFHEKESGLWPAPTCEGFGSEGAQKQLLKLTKEGVLTKESAERMMSRHFRKCVTDTKEEFQWRDGVKLNLSFYEHLMMWPHGWTDLKPLETDKFQQWLKSHGIH